MATRASMVKDGSLIPHTAGVYFQSIPKDPVTDLSAIPFKEAAEDGWIKIDLLHLSLLDLFETKQELLAVSKITPNWSLLLKDDVVCKLFHLSNHGPLLKQIRPKSVMQVADTVALIRPGKKHLLIPYLNNPTKISKTSLYERTDKMFFKKPHAVAYAKMICVHLNMIEAGIC